MYKKFLSCVLTAMLVVVGTMFTSCNDYDDDIKNLRDQIAQTESDLSSLVSQKYTELENEISSLKSQLAALDEAYKAADAALQAAIEKAIEDAKKYADDAAAAAEQAAKDYADIQAAQAYEAAVAAAKEMIEEAVATLQAQIDAVNVTLAQYGIDIAALQAKDAELQTQIDANAAAILALIDADALLQQGIDEAKALAAAAQEAAELAQATADQALADAKNAQETADKALEAAKYALYLAQQNGEDISELQERVTELENELAELTKRVADLETQLAELSGVVESLSKTVANLESQISILNAQVEALIEQAAQNAADILALQAELNDLKESNAYILEWLGGLQGDVDALTQLVEENQEKVEKALADLQEELEQAIADVYDALDALDASLRDEIAKALADAESYTDAAIEALYYVIQAYVDDSIQQLVDYMNNKFGGLDVFMQETNDAISDLYEYARALDLAIGQLQSSLEKMSRQLGSIYDYLVNYINQFFVLGNRLSSLVFAPTTYVNGIESICFNDVVLSYTAWTLTDGSAPTQDGGEVYELPIPDQIHVEEYLYSPSNVAAKSIEKLAYVSNTATEISTKAVSEKTPIVVKDYEFTTNENGVKVLAVTVELVDELPAEDNTFTTVALKAFISDDYKLDSEAGEEVAVFSDWARVYNVACEATPYIHNAAYTTEVEDEKGDEHWYDYAKIYALGGTTSDPAVYPNDANAPDLTIDSYVAADVAYTETFDLNTLVTVCDQEGNFYDLDTYGFAFEFSAVDFYCDKDNQADYASIDKDGIISSVGYRDAIGKYPVIQVTLVDTNNNAIVDVRYFVIHWTDEAATYDLGEFTLYGSYYDTCGAVYELIISGVDLQRKLASISEISLEELTTTYELVGLFAEPYDGTNDVDETLGTIAYTNEYTITDPETGDETTYTTDYCLIWTVTPTISQDDYDAGEIAFTAYGAFVNEAGDNYVTFELYTDFSIAQMELLFVHNTPYWTSSVNDFGYLARISNPTVEDDAVFGMPTFATTQLVCDLYIGYINNGVTPSGRLSVVEQSMINFGELYLRFDETRAQELADETGTAVSDWTFNNTDMNLYYKGVMAAHIQYDDDIAAMVCYLYDGAIDTHHAEGSAGTATATPSEGAKLLVGKFVPMVMYSTWCGCTQILDRFDVAFMTPLSLESSEIVEVTLKDIYAGGSSSEASLDNTIKLVENAVQNHRTVWSNYVEDPSDEILVAWYGVQDPVYDLENATTNLTLDGNVSDEEDFENWTVLLSEIKTMDGDPVYTIEYDEETNELIFYNHSGTAITKAFKICIPVTIATKWQDVIALNVIVTVEPSLN